MVAAPTLSLPITLVDCLVQSLPVPGRPHREPCPLVLSLVVVMAAWACSPNSGPALSKSGRAPAQFGLGRFLEGNTLKNWPRQDKPARGFLDLSGVGAAFRHPDRESAGCAAAPGRACGRPGAGSSAD